MLEFRVNVYSSQGAFVSPPAVMRENSFTSQPVERAAAPPALLQDTATGLPFQQAGLQQKPKFCYLQTDSASLSTFCTEIISDPRNVAQMAAQRTPSPHSPAAAHLGTRGKCW